MPHADPNPKPARDLRLDMFRGLTLVMIYINHVPGTIYEWGTSRNFGFSDAAEAFVLMSGMSAGLAYVTRFRTLSFWRATAAVWARARTLYLVHIAITVIALAIIAGGAVWLSAPELLDKWNVGTILRQPLGTLVGLPILGFSVDYFNILQLYVVLLIVTPFLFPLALKRPLVLLAASILVWALAGQFRLNFPNYPASGGWFFDPLSWQLIFVIGLLAGIAMRDGSAFVPWNSRLFWSAVAFLIFILLWVKIPALGAAGRDVLGWFADRGAPSYITWFDKAYLPLPRLLHALALAYVLSSIPAIALLAEMRWLEPLRLLGRHALPVFAVGSLLSAFFRVVRTGLQIQSDPLLDGAMLALGLAILVGMAMVLDAIGRPGLPSKRQTIVAEAPGDLAVEEPQRG